MAGRDENGCQVTRRNTAGISKEGEYQTKFLHFSTRLDVRIMEQILSYHSCFLEIFSQLWLTLAERHLEQRGVDWKLAEKICFNEWSNPDDEELGIQIVKVRMRNVHPFYSSRCSTLNSTFSPS